MTSRQRLSIEESSLKDKLNALLEIQHPEELTDTQRGEMEQYTNRLKNLGPELRAAIAAEGTEQAQAAGTFSDVATPEQAEIRSLLQRVQIGDYLKPALGGVGLTGVPAELNAALEVETVGADGSIKIPWVALLGTESRSLDKQHVEKRAFTTASGNNDGSLTQQTILMRLFGQDVAANLGVRISEVPTGRNEIPVLSAGVVPDQVKETVAAADAVAASFDFTIHKPKRISGQYAMTHELIASVKDVEGAIRRDLADAVKSRMVHLMINDTAPTNANPQKVEGFLDAVTAPDDAPAVAAFQDFASSHSQFDGIYASTEREVSSVVAVDALKFAAGVYQAGSGESGSEAMERRSQSCISSSYVPSADASTKQSKDNLYHLAGPNGGGPMSRTDAQISMWSSLSVIRDLYSSASVGINLIWVGLWDFSVIRSAAYKRVSFKLGT